MDREDWQLSKVGVSERIQHLHKTKQWTDCTFKVSGENCSQVFQAHKILLACCSPVFEAMLFGPIAEKNVILVSDVEPEAFRILLEYIYTDCTSFPSLEATCATLYAAKKYLLPHLRQSCVMHLVNLLRPSNACSLHEFASALEEKELAQESLKVMCTYLPELLQDPGFVHISRGTLEAILREDLLNADGGESSLIAASMAWAQQECRRCSMNPEVSFITCKKHESSTNERYEFFPSSYSFEVTI
ncbi:BTB/POZ domain-containing protein 6-B-like [Hetaerina americana]|uniref:BTB/POZ domain-containing protein 6-B-like n=1 Tax=Hetaerina americana TaxID=62018 RepID=UPI003A7F2298